ncbi:MAG: hypothetical protein QOI30_2887 [Mycobacterium sp.]|nr:hypothetical protein [Mycobacterium sp.]
MPNLTKISISQDRLAVLESGAIESATHVEQMAMNQARLFAEVFPSVQGGERLTHGGFISKLRAGGQALFEAFGAEAPEVAHSKTSDTVRGWGAFSVPLVCGDELNAAIDLLVPFADDHHFAVREWAWLALRPYVVANPLLALEALEPLWSSPSDRLRRF